MRKLVFATLAILISCASYAEKATVSPYTAVDKKALAMPDSVTGNTMAIARYISANFTGDRDKTRAIFVWLANNIRYDLANMYAINFYEKREEKVTKALATREGICEAYAAIFQDVCTKLGIKSYVVEGYTRQNGFASYIPHAWNAANVGGEWLLFDPTWGSGYVSNSKFVRKMNESYFAAKPATLIKSHMPFDYLWQFLQYPISNQEFYDGKTAENKSKPLFSFADSLKVYEALSETDQLSAAAERIERNGLKNAMVFDRLHHIKAQLEHDRQSGTVNAYNGAIADYNEGLGYYNEFIEYRNKQFTPSRSDAEIQAMLDAATNSFSSARKKLTGVKQPDQQTATLVIQFNKSLEEAESHTQEMQEWLKKYFSKSRFARKSMFYKITWMGMPLI